MNKKRLLCGLLALAMVMPLAACETKKENSRTKRREVTWFTEIDVGDTAMWSTAEVLKKVVEETGITPKIITGGKEKLNMLIASNDMSDLITFLPTNGTTMSDLIADNGLYTMEEIDKQFESGFLNEIPDTVKTKAVYRDDGNLYGRPGMFVDDKVSPAGSQAFNVRADIYEELGSPDMTTPDGFVNALKAFKEKYPTIGGKKTIPLDMNMQCWSLYILERSFGITDNFYLDKNDGIVKVKWRNPQYRELVKFMARLNREDLLDKEMFVKQSNQVSEDRATGLVFCAPMAFDGLWDTNAVLMRSNPNTYFKVIEPLKVVDDPIFTPVAPYSYWTMTSIPKSAKNADTAAEFLRYMWSPEGNMLMNYGIEGKHYTFNNEGKVVIPEDVANEKTNNSDRFSKETGIFTFRLLYRGNLFEFERVSEGEKRDADRKIANKYTKYVDPNLTQNMEPSKSEPDIQNIKTTMDDIVNATIHKYVLEPDEDKALAALDAMLAEFDRIGVGKLEDFRTEQYKKNLAVFGEYSPQIEE